MRVPEEGDRFLTYRELAERLGAYVSKMGFTHVELLPIAEHPFYGSWGYQPIGLFAPTRRYGTPADFMRLSPRNHDDRGGVDRVAYGVATDLRGGLGFGFKWNMGWMHDVLHYMSQDPIHRKYHHSHR